jgi:hypothetical protein
MEFVKPAGKIPFRRVRAKHPEVSALQDSIVDLVQEIDKRFAAAYFQGLPINMPFPFLAGRFPATFTLGEKFIPCDGRRIVSAASPLYGQFAPVIAFDLGSTEDVTWYIRILD